MFKAAVLAFLLTPMLVRSLDPQCDSGSYGGNPASGCKNAINTFCSDASKQPQVAAKNSKWFCRSADNGKGLCKIGGENDSDRNNSGGGGKSMEIPQTVCGPTLQDIENRCSSSGGSELVLPQYFSFFVKTGSAVDSPCANPTTGEWLK